MFRILSVFQLPPIFYNSFTSLNWNVHHYLSSHDADLTYLKQNWGDDTQNNGGLEAKNGQLQVFKKWI